MKKYSPADDLVLGGHYLEGPFFKFDEEDKLAEVSFSYSGFHNSLASLGCSGIATNVAEKAIEFLDSALQNKYERLGADEGWIVYSDGITRVWMEYTSKYEKSPSGAFYQCNKMTTNMWLRYADQSRVSRLIDGLNADAAQEAIDLL